MEPRAFFLRSRQRQSTTSTQAFSTIPRHVSNLRVAARHTTPTSVENLQQMWLLSPQESTIQSDIVHAFICCISFYINHSILSHFWSILLVLASKQAVIDTTSPSREMENNFWLFENNLKRSISRRVDTLACFAFFILFAVCVTAWVLSGQISKQ